MLEIASHPLNKRFSYRILILLAAISIIIFTLSGLHFSPEFRRRVSFQQDHESSQQVSQTQFITVTRTQTVTSSPTSSTFSALPTLPALQISHSPPQLNPIEDGYTDVLVNLSIINPIDWSSVSVPRYKYAILLPTYVSLIPLTSASEIP
jgi:hypothetical protein